MLFSFHMPPFLVARKKSLPCCVMQPSTVFSLAALAVLELSELAEEEVPIEPAELCELEVSWPIEPVLLDGVWLLVLDPELLLGVWLLLLPLG